MDKQKKIEEMSKLIVSINDNDYTYDNDGHKRLNYADADEISEELLKYYQPKIPEGAVVLTKEEYSALKNFLQGEYADLNVLRKALNIDFSNVVPITKQEYEALIDSGGWHDGYCTAVEESKQEILNFKEKYRKDKNDYAEWCMKKASKETVKKFVNLLTDNGKRQTLPIEDAKDNICDKAYIISQSHLYQVAKQFGVELQRDH